MQVFNIGFDDYRSNAYYVMDDAVTASCLIDPSVDPERCFAQCGNFPKPSAVILTHTHYDHMVELQKWKDAGCTVYVPKMEIPFLNNPRYHVSDLFGVPFQFSGDVIPVVDGMLIPLGRETLRALSTPGHTLDGYSYIGSNAVFVGDVLFSNGMIGRTDFAGGSYEILLSSITRVLSLDEHTVIYPGHGTSTTVSKERKLHRI